MQLNSHLMETKKLGLSLRGNCAGGATKEEEGGGVNANISDLNGYLNSWFSFAPQTTFD